MNETAKPQGLSWAKKFGIGVLVAVTGWLALSEMIISVDVRPPREVYRECRQNAAVTWRNEQLRCRDAMREGQTTRAEAGVCIRLVEAEYKLEQEHCHKTLVEQQQRRREQQR